MNQIDIMSVKQINMKLQQALLETAIMVYFPTQKQKIYQSKNTGLFRYDDYIGRNEVKHKI